MKRFVRLAAAACVATFVAATAFAQSPEIVYSDDFQRYAAGTKPSAWDESEAGVYRVLRDPGVSTNFVFGTTTPSQKQRAIHRDANARPQHGAVATLISPRFDAADGFELRGRLFREAQNAAAGFALFGEDGYLLVVGPKGTQLFAPDGSGADGAAFEANRWLRVAIHAERIDDVVRVQAKVWNDGEAEPAGWPLEVHDRLSAGALALWSASGPALFDDLVVRSRVDRGEADHTPPAVELFESGSPASGSLALNRDARISLRARDESGIASATITVDGAPYEPPALIGAEGRHVVHARAVDAAGNAAEADLELFIDKTAPAVSVVEGEQSLHARKFNRDVAPVVEVEDISATTVIATVDGAVWNGGTIAAEGHHTLNVSVRDALGWVTTLAPIDFTIDKTPPVVQVLESGRALAGRNFNRNVLPIVDVHDLTATTISATIDDTAWNGGEIATEGEHTLRLTVKDEVGWETLVEPVAFRIDRSSPRVSITVDGQPLTSDAVFNHDVAPVITADDATKVTIEATLDGAPFSSGNVVSAEQLHTLIVTVKDELGATTNVDRTFFVDKTPPAVTVTESGRALAGLVLPRDAKPDFNAADLTPVAWSILDNGAPFTRGSVISTEGAHHLTLRATDAAGWSVDQDVAFIIDKTAPVVAIAESGGALADGAILNRDARVTFTAADVSNVTITATVDDAAFASGGTISSEGVHALIIKAVDEAGHETLLPPLRFTIDKTPPAVAITESGKPLANARFGRAVLPRIEVTDLTAVTIDAKLDDQSYAPDTLVDGEGEHALSVVVRDAAGWQTPVPAVRFFIDKSVPVITITESGAPLADGAIFNRDARPSFAAADASNVAIAATLDDQPFASDSIITAEGVHRLVVTAKDETGQQASASLAFTIDKTAPRITVDVTHDAILKADVTPHIETSDLTAVTLAAKLDGAAYTAGTAIATEGRHVLEITARDAAGWETIHPPLAFTLDKTPPVIGIDVADATISGTDVTPHITVTDLTAVTTNATLDGSAFTSGTTVGAEGKHTLAVTATDAAGWTTTAPPVAFVIDTQKPAITITESGSAFAGGKFNRDLAPQIAVSDATTTTIEATVDGNAWTSGTTIATEGNHTLLVRATDAAGHTAETALLFAIDKTPPVVTITEGGQPLVSGSGFARAVKPEIVVTDASSLVTSTTLNGEPFVSGSEVMKEGRYTLAVTATDEVGWTTTIEPLAFFIDLTPPVVHVFNGETELADGSWFNTDVAPRAVVDDASVKAITATLNGQPYALGVAITTEGDYSLVVKVEDAAGLVTEVPAIAFHIDKTPPHMAFLTPAGNQTIATAGILATGDADDAIRVIVNGVEATIDAATKQFATPELVLIEGENTISAEAFDRAGNRGTAAVMIRLDTQAPEVSITSPRANACLDATQVTVSGVVRDVALERVVITAGTTSLDATLSDDRKSFTATLPVDEGALTISVQATDTNGHAAVSSVPLRIDRTKPAVELTEGGAPLSARVTRRALAPRVVVHDADAKAIMTATLDGQPFESGTTIDAEKTYVLRATARDCAGHVSDEQSVTFTIDRTPPALVAMTPAEGAILAEPSAVSGTLSEAATVMIEGTSIAASAMSTSFTLSPSLAEGTNRVILIARDAAGNESRFVRTFRLKSSAPSLQIVEAGEPIANDALFNRAVTPSLATDDPTATLSATLNAAPFASGTTISADGRYTLSATATDVAGHVTPASVTFTIDRTRPTVAITSPSNGASIDDETVEVRGASNGADRVLVNGIVAALTQDGAFTATIPLDLGPNTIVATATDAARNNGSASVDVLRGGGGLAILLTAPPDGLSTNRPTTIVAGQIIAPASAASVTINGTAVAFDTSGFFRNNSVALAEGDNAITATVTSKNGKTNSVSAHVVADFTPPQLRVTANGSDLGENARFASAPALALEASDNVPAGLTTKLTIDGAVISGAVPALANGGHALTAIARDAAGNETCIDRTFFIGTLALTAGCSLSDFEPADGTAVATDSVRITGRSIGAAAVLVNGARAQLADGSFAIDLALAQGRNEVTIRCANEDGSPTSDAASTLVLHRVERADITITTPANGSVATSDTIAVSGTVGNGVVSGDVNGIAFTPSNGTFSVANVPLASGLNVIAARARTSSGRAAVTTVRVLRDGAPQLAITSPLYGTTTGAASIDVSGTYANIDPSTLAAGAISAQTHALTDTTGTFTITLPLAHGANALTLSGRNRAGAAANASVSVTRDDTAPSIAITTPLDNAYVAANTVPVGGTFSAADGAQVQVAGVPATINGNTFSANVTLNASASGITPLVARVTTPDGASATDSVRVLRFAAAPAVSRTFPEANAVAVDPGVAVVVLFTNAIDATTATALTVTDGANALVDGTRFVDKDAITFAPHLPLRAGEHYTVTIATTLQDLAGTPLAAPHTFGFAVATTAPLAAPAIDQSDETGCFTQKTITGHAGSGGARVRLSLDGVELNTTAADDGTFQFRVSFSGESGFHVARVRELAADGTLSPERAITFRINCALPQVLGASLDRAAKTLTIQFSKPMQPSTLVAAPNGSIVLGTLAGSVTVNGETAVVTYADLPNTALALTIRTTATDTTGAALAAEYTRTFAIDDGATAERGKGTISGAVLDASSGRPLANAAIEIRGGATLLTAITNDRGRYARALDEGPYTIRASASGYTTAWRQVIVPAGAGVVPIDIRLTRRGSTFVHGGDTAVTTKVELTLDSASLSPGHTAHVTAVGAQSLAGLLPLGWSPLASAEIIVDDSTDPAPLPGAKLTFSIDTAAVAAASQSLSLVQYDSDSDEWRVVEAVTSATTFDIASSGSYALVYADRAAQLDAPPPARSGAPLKGVANPCVATPDVCRMTSRGFTLDPKAVVPNGRTVATLTTDGATQSWPSGTAVQAFIDEQLNLADGRVLVDPPFATDLLIYRTLAGDAGVAQFHLAPSAQAAAVTLRDGVDHIRIVDYPGRVDRGTLLGSEGGRVPGDDSVTIDVPAGATAELLHATVAGLSPSELDSFGSIAGFRIAGGFALTLTRASESVAADATTIAPPQLLQPARATFSVDGAASQVIVAEVLDQSDYGVVVRLAAIASPNGANVFATRTLTPVQLPLDGIVRGGRYLILVADAPIAYAFGQVRFGSSGLAAANVRVTSGIGSPMSSPLGVVDVTRTGGTFVVPVAAKPAVPFSLMPRATSTGDGATVVAQASPDADAYLPFGTLTLAAQPPRLQSLTPADGALLDAGAAFVVNARFDVALDPSSATNAIVVTNIATGTTLAGGAAIAGNTVTFNASEPLAAATRYTITLAPSIRGTNGAPLAQTITTQFTTRALPAGNTAIHPELIRITIPDDDGRSTIRGTAGALPAAATAIAVRRGNFFIESYQTTVAGDGSFSFDAGYGDAHDRISIDDAIDLQVLDPVSKAIVAVIELTPFVTADGRGFIAPTTRTTTFTSADAITVTVPANAFETPTRIDVVPATETAFATVPNFAHDALYATSVELRFEGVARERIDVSLPVPAGADTARTYLLGYRGDSIRGPRVMIVDTLRIANGRFTTADDAATAPLRIATNSVVANGVINGAALRQLLLGVTRSGIYAAVSLQLPSGSDLKWGVMDALQYGVDLFWDTWESLFVADYYVAEKRGRVAIPLATNKGFQVVGFDSSTGIQGFSKIYDALPNNDPGDSVALDNPSPDTRGPFPISATPFRVEGLDVMVANRAISSIPNFLVTQRNGIITVAGDPQRPLTPPRPVTIVNTTRGGVVTRAAGVPLSIAGEVGDHIVVLIEQPDVDPFTSLAIVFSEPLATGAAVTDEQLDAFLRARVIIESESFPGAGFSPMTETAHFRLDSGARRLLIELPASLRRGARYRVGLRPTLTDASSLAIGQVLEKSGAVPPLTEPLWLYFGVRAPGGQLASFDISSGGIRDQALNGNVLFTTALDGGLYAYDVADPASLGSKSKPLGHAEGNVTDYWAIATDQHGRVYATGMTGLFGIVRTFRLEDFLSDGTTTSEVTHRATGIVSWRPGAAASLGIPSGQLASNRAEAIPRKLQVLVQDRDDEPWTYADTADFRAAHQLTKSGTADDFDLLVLRIKRAAAFRYLKQRITIENSTADLRWSVDADVDGEDVTFIARPGDRIRIIRNYATYGVISLFGYGVGVYDLNAIEANDDPARGATYVPIAEQVRMTAAELREECLQPGQTFAPQAIPDLTFSPDAMIVAEQNSPNLRVFAVDALRGVLDLEIQPPASKEEAAQPSDRPTACDERAPIGLVFRARTPEGLYEHPRIKALHEAFVARANGREPNVRFTGAAYYRWTLAANDNKQVSPAITTATANQPAFGERGSAPGEALVREYMLVPANEFGLLVIEVGGTPPYRPVGHRPLENDHLADIIWIPNGAYAVRVIPRTNLATVVDGAGRVLLVDLSRIDERFGSGVIPPSDALFPTVQGCLAHQGSEGVGIDDPRIVWKSEPGLATGTLAPVIDSDTGFLFLGRLNERTTNVVAALDPRIAMKVDLGAAGGLGETTQIVPLGVDPTAAIQRQLTLADPQRRPDASPAAFRLELTLPGAISDALGSQLSAAIESEAVAGAVTMEMPDGYPRAHLRRTTRDGRAAPRAVTNFALQRVVPQSLAAQLRHQKGFNKFISPWIVAVADPRAGVAYQWPSGTTAEQQRAAGCYSCARPRHLQGLGEAQNVWELYTNGRFIAVRPDLCTAANCSTNAFTGTPYAYLGRNDRFAARFATTMADTVRPPSVLVAANAPPVAGGLLQETTYLHSGEVETSSVDVDAGGRAGWNVSFDRTYRSRTIGTTPLGVGWDSSLFRRLRVLADGSVEYRDGAGELWRFGKPDADGHFASPAGLFLRLSRTTRGYALIDQQWRITGFDSFGRIAYEADEFAPNAPALDRGNVIRYLYDAGGRLAEVIDPVGRSTVLRYDADGLLTEVEDWRGRVVKLTHESGRLIAVQLPRVDGVKIGDAITSATPTIRYTYDGASATANDALELAANLTSIVDPHGGTARVAFGYGSGAERDKVTSQLWATGETATFHYDGATATVVDALKQERRYQLTAAAGDYNGDRAHVAHVEETNVPVSTIAFGQLPQTLSLVAPRQNVNRGFSYTYDANGLVKTATLDGLRRTTYNYKAAAGAPGAVLDTIETTAAGGGAARTRTYRYGTETFASANRGTFLTGVDTKLGASEQSLSWHAPSASSLVNAATNSSVKETLEVLDNGLPHVTRSEGGTDAEGEGTSSVVDYHDASAPEALRALPSSITVGDLKTSISYSNDGLTTIVTDPRGVVTTSVLDQWLRPKGVQLDEGNLHVDEQTIYDVDGRVVQQSRRRRGATHDIDYGYDAVGRVTDVTVHDVANGETANGSAVSNVEYHLADGRVVRHTPGGATITEVLDGLGRVTSRTTSTGKGADIVEELVYDLAGNLVWSRDNHTAAATAYDIHGRAVQTLHADLTKSVTDYDALGHVTAMRRYASDGALIAESTAEVTSTGQLKAASTKVDDQQVRTAVTRWDGAGRTTSVAAGGRVSKSVFDAAGRLTKWAAGSGNADAVSGAFASFEMLEADGDRVKRGVVRDRAGRTIDVVNDYDAFGNATRNQVGSLAWEQKFDEDGNVVEQSLPARGASTYSYDARGSLLDETRPNDTTIHHGYEVSGAAVSYRDAYRSTAAPAGETTTTKNDVLGRPIERTYPDATKETWDYDGERLGQYTDRQGRVFRYHYDDAGRVQEVVDGSDVALERYAYDTAGRLFSMRTADAENRFEQYDYEGRPRLTTQTRFANHSGFESKPEVLDSYEQSHEWNELGERKAWTMPHAPGKELPEQWTARIEESHDAAGNVEGITRIVSGGKAAPLLVADYRDAGRPSKRTLTTDCANESGCTSASVVREYDYDDAGLMSKLSVLSRGIVIAGSDVTRDGVQVQKVKLLGVSGDQRANEYTYDALSRVETVKIAALTTAAASTEVLDDADFREKVVRPVQPGAPPSLSFEHRTGHKIDVARRGSLEARKFLYCNGAERIDDGHFTYEFDARGRLIRATEHPPAVPGIGRRIHYEYSANDRLVGRRAEYARITDVKPQADCAPILTLEGDWQLEDRPAVLAADALPPLATFVWDPVTDRLIAEFDANGQPLRQFIHGGDAYDDPLEVTMRGSSDTEVRRLYPIYDEAAADTLQAIVNANGDLVARSFMNGAYGEDETGLNGPAVEQLNVSTSPSGTVEITLRSTDRIDESTLATGTRLAILTSSGKVVRSTPAAPQLIDNFTIRWTLTASEWQSFSSPSPVTVNGEELTPSAISIAVTSSLRSTTWPASVPYTPAPTWSSLRSSPAYPAEYRESLTTFPSSATPFTAPSLAALGSDVATAERAGGVVGWQGLPYREGRRGAVYVRNRWYAPETGTFLSPDPLGYRDSSNLYAAFAMDPVNNSDPTGERVPYKEDIAMRGVLLQRVADLDAQWKQNGRATFRAYKKIAMQRGWFDTSGVPGEYNYLMQNTAVSTAAEYEAARAYLLNDVATFDAAVARADEMEPVYYVPLQGYMTRTADDDVTAAWAQMAFNVSMAPNVYATLRLGKAFRGTVTAEPVGTLRTPNGVSAQIPVRVAIARGWSPPRGSANPNTLAASRRGSSLHADRPGNLPDQLRQIYPDTEFDFTSPGRAGQDVLYRGGKHPSEYPGSAWPAGVNYGDFKPDTPGGLKTFTRDQRVKWVDPTIMLRYDPVTGKLR